MQIMLTKNVYNGSFIHTLKQESNEREHSNNKRWSRQKIPTQVTFTLFLPGLYSPLRTIWRKNNGGTRWRLERGAQCRLRRVTRCPSLRGTVPHFHDFSGVPQIETMSHIVTGPESPQKCLKNASHAMRFIT